MIDRRPALIARPTGVADVVAAVRYARAEDTPIAIRCGGHSTSGHNDGALVIDLSLMKGICVAPQRRVARVQGGATIGRARPRGAGLRAGDARRPRHDDWRGDLDQGTQENVRPDDVFWFNQNIEPTARTGSEVPQRA
jgi:FAD binding domain